MAARVYAYSGITLYESLLNGMPENYTLAGQIVHMPDMPLPPEGTYDWLAVANRSLYRVVSDLLPDTPKTTAALSEHYETVQTEREAEVGTEVVHGKNSRIHPAQRFDTGLLSLWKSR